MARRKAEEAEEGDERWLVSFADMMTLLFALFMVLFSISSVNISKAKDLQASLKDSFSGRVLPGGKGIAAAGGPSSSTKAIAPPLAQTPDLAAASSRKTAKEEAAQFKKIKQKVDAIAAKSGLNGQVTTRITRDGLMIRLLTDKLIFASGSATPNPASGELLSRLAIVLAEVPEYPVTIMGHTDDRPIRSAQFPSNWELSTARASAVARVLISDQVSAQRLTPSGRGELDPITDNSSAVGRQYNRRVELLLPRQAKVGSGGKQKIKITTP